MQRRNPFGSLVELWRALSEALRYQTTEEEAASYRLARSARGFSRRAKKVVDDKLTFSATLMRAGEVEAANALLAEVEDEVRSEEAALIEQVNEVKMAQSLCRDRITRLRLVRALATALVGASLLGMSAMGMAVASMLRERAEAFDRRAAAAPAGEHRRVTGGRDGTHTARRKVAIGNMKVALSPHELQQFRALTAGRVDPYQLAAFLSDLDLPGDVVRQAVAAVTNPVEAVKKQIADVPALVLDTKKKADKPPASPPPEEEKPKPSPSPSEDDDEGSGSGGGSGGEEEEEGDEGGDPVSPPLP